MSPLFLIVTGVILIVAERQSGAFLDCRVRGRPSGAALAVDGGAAAIAFDVHLEDGGVMNERRSLLITANQPFGEWGKIFPDQAMTVAVVDRLQRPG